MALRKQPVSRPKRRKPASQWHSKKDITSLTRAGRKEPGLPKKRTWGPTGKEVFGQGIFGDIYLGRVRFKGGKPKRVAIKRFSRALTKKDVEAFKKAIHDLTAVGIRLPKTGFYKYGGEWVQITQLFAKGGKSKFINPEARPIDDPAIGKKFVRLGAKIINTGYPFWPDMIGIMGKEVIAFDLDALISKKLKKSLRENPKSYIAETMRQLCFSLTANRAIRTQIFEAFIKSLKNKKHQEYAREALQNINLLPENF